MDKDKYYLTPFFESNLNNVVTVDYKNVIQIPRWSYTFLRDLLKFFKLTFFKSYFQRIIFRKLFKYSDEIFSNAKYFKFKYDIRFSFCLATVDEIRQIFINLKSNAVGSDSISAKMLQLCLNIIAPVLTHIENCCLDVVISVFGNLL